MCPHANCKYFVNCASGLGKSVSTLPDNEKIRIYGAVSLSDLTAEALGKFEQRRNGFTNCLTIITISTRAIGRPFGLNTITT
jgi:hypothetical protein